MTLKTSVSGVVITAIATITLFSELLPAQARIPQGVYNAPDIGKNIYVGPSPWSSQSGQDIWCDVPRNMVSRAQRRFGDGGTKSKASIEARGAVYFGGSCDTAWFRFPLQQGVYFSKDFQNGTDMYVWQQAGKWTYCNVTNPDQSTAARRKFGFQEDMLKEDLEFSGANYWSQACGNDMFN